MNKIADLSASLRGQDAPQPYGAEIAEYIRHHNPQPAFALAEMLAHTLAERDRMKAALEEIRELAKPGQELGISAAIDLICDIYNGARKGLGPTGKGADNG